MRPLSIRHALPLLFVTPLVVAVTVIGWLAFINGQQAVDKLTLQLNDKSTTAIEDSVQKYFDAHQLLLQTEAEIIQNSKFDVKDLNSIERYFWRRIQIKNSMVDTFYFGTERGEYVSVERQNNGRLIDKIRDASTGLERKVYNLDNQGNRTNLIKSERYEPRSRPWYKIAKQVGKPTWSPISQSFSTGEFIIDPVVPIYDKQTGAFHGTLATEIPLAKITDFLRNLKISPTGKALLVEHSGKIIASSNSEPSSIANKNGQKRINFNQSSEPLIKATGEFLLKQFSSFSQIQQKQQLTFSLNDKRQFVQVTPLKDDWGLDWLIVTVIPESDFMEQIYADTLFTFSIGITVTLVAIGLGLATVRWITQPIQRLSKVAKDIESQKFDPHSLDPIASRQDELGELARVFSTMAGIVHSREENLEQLVQQLRQENDQVKKATHLVEITKNDKAVRLEQLLEDAKKARIQSSDPLPPLSVNRPTQA